MSFWGLGAGVPMTPWDWSFDLDEQEAAVMLEDADGADVLIVHSPPFGHVDTSSAGEHLGSRAILQAIEASEPSLAVCGHIHESWGAESRMGPTRVVNLGPDGALLDVGELAPLGPVGPRLGAVAADVHRAPVPRAVARAVVEGPQALVGSADLDAVPLAGLLAADATR